MDITLKQDCSIYNTFWCPLNMLIIRNRHMSAHIRMALTQISLNVPIINGRLGLGMWQAIYLYEHRTHALNRHVQLHLLGER